MTVSKQEFNIAAVTDGESKIKENSEGGILYMFEEPGHKVIGTIKSVKGTCNWGHEVRDRIELGGHNTGGLCGFFYHSIFASIILLQFGGQYPWREPDRMEVECPDKSNAVIIELVRER